MGQNSSALMQVLPNMRASPSNVSTQVAGLKAIVSFSDTSDEARVTAVKAGAIPAVASAMRTLLTSAAVQVEACRAVRSLVARDRAASLAAIKEGIVDLIISTMKAHVASPPVASASCSALMAVVLAAPPEFISEILVKVFSFFENFPSLSPTLSDQLPSRPELRLPWQ